MSQKEARIFELLIKDSTLMGNLIDHCHAMPGIHLGEERCNQYGFIFPIPLIHPGVKEVEAIEVGINIWPGIVRQNEKSLYIEARFKYEDTEPAMAKMTLCREDVLVDHVDERISDKELEKFVQSLPKIMETVLKLGVA